MFCLVAPAPANNLYRQGKAMAPTPLAAPLVRDARDAQCPPAEAAQPSAPAPQRNPNDPPALEEVWILGQGILYPAANQKTNSPLCWHNTRKVVAAHDELFISGWESGTENDSEIVITWWDAFFGLWTNPAQLSQSQSDAGRLDLVAGPDGTVHACWHQDYSAATDVYEVFYSQLPAGGFAWTTPVMVSDGDALESNFPTIGVDNAGNVTVRWSEFLRDAAGNILDYQGYKARTSADNGVSWGTPSVWATEDTLRVWPAMCVDRVSGDIYLADNESASDPADEYSDLEIYYYNKAANMWQGPEIPVYGGGVGEPFHDVTHTSCAAGPDGVIHILFAQTTHADPGWTWIDNQVSAPVNAQLFLIHGTYGNWSAPEPVYPGDGGIYPGVEGVYPDSTWAQFCSYAQVGLDAQNRIFISTRAYEYFNGSFLTGFGDMYSDIGGTNWQPEAWVASKSLADDGEWVWTRASDINLRPDSIGVKYTKLSEHVAANGPALVWDETYDGARPTNVMFTRVSDFSAPGSVTGIQASRPVLNGPVTLTWVNPGDADLGGIRVVRTTSGKASLVGLRRGSIPLDADGGWMYDPEEDVWVLTPDETTGEMPVTFTDEDPPAGAVFYTLAAFDDHLHHTYPIPDFAVAEVDSIELSADGPQENPTTLRVNAIRPNPVTTDRVEISYSLPGMAPATLTVHDACGRLVRTLSAEMQAGEPGVARWDLTDGRGARVGNGVYVCRLQQGDSMATGRIVIIR
jgi:hypothetical protein